MNFQDIKFSRQLQIQTDFFKTLRQRVNTYFSDRDLSRHGNLNMLVKTVFMISLYLVPYLMVISGRFSGFWMLLLLWSLMGIGAAGIGLSVMHDANHGAYSRYPKVNYYLGYIMNLIGGSATNWRLQHNLLHHSFTNIDGLDEDINAGKLLRFSPHQQHLWIHRGQHIYAWFLYGLMTMMWVTTKDFRQLLRYHREGLLESQGLNFRKLVAELLIFKALYYAYILVIPLLVLSNPWWQILFFFLVMHFILGLTLACVFQPAHVMHTSEFPLPDPQGNMENSWAIHQMLTTTNFAPRSRLLSWYIGGLNFQIEHHLFPNICHVHYPKIANIVKQTAREFGLPYHSYPTFAHALWYHGKMLYLLGRPQAV